MRQGSSRRDYDTVSGGSGGSPPDSLPITYAEYTLGSDVTITTGVSKNLEWDSVVQDPDGWHDGTNKERFYPDVFGTYLLCCNLIWEYKVDDICRQSLIFCRDVSAATNLRVAEFQYPLYPREVNRDPWANMIGQFKYDQDASDYFYVFVSQSTGADVKIRSESRIVIAKMRTD